MPTLVYWDSDGIERVFELGTEPILIGRAAECAIRSEDTRVSRRHARLISNGRDCWVEDLRSSNGVYVGPNRVEQSVIPPGEIVIVGSILLQLQANPGEMAAVSAGTHAQLCVWLKMEREKHLSLQRERDSLTERVSQIERSTSTNMGVDNAEVERQVRSVRTQMATDHARDVERMRQEAEVAKEQALAQLRSDMEAHFEATKQELIEDLNRQRTEIDVSDQLQVQVQQLWSNLRAAKQTVRQLEEDGKEREARVAAAESTRTEMQEHAKKLATEVQRLSRQDKERQEQLTALEAERAELGENRMELELQLAEMQEQLDQARARVADQLHAAETEAATARDALERTQAELASARADAHAHAHALEGGAQTGLAQAQERAAELERRCQELGQAHETAAKERDLLASERDLLIDERDELTSELLELRDADNKEREQSHAVIAQAKTRLQELAAQVNEVAADRDDLAQEYDQLVTQYDELALERDELAQERERMLAERASANQGSQAELTAARERLGAMEAELAHVAEQRDDALGQLERMSSEIALMREELEDLREQSQNAVPEVPVDSDVRLAAIHKEKQAIAKDRERLKEELDLALKERDKLVSEVGSLRASHVTEHKESSHRLAQAHEDSERMEQEISALQEQLAQVAILRQELEATRERYTTLEREGTAERDQLAEQIAQLSEDLREFEAALKERDLEISSLREREDELAAGLESAQQTNAFIESLRAERDTERARADELEQHSAAADERVAALESQSQELSEALEQARVELRTLHDQLVDAPSPDALQEDNQRLKSELENLQEELAEVGEQAALYSQERAHRSSAETRAAELEEHTRELEERMRELEERARDLEERARDLEDQLAGASAQTAQPQQGGADGALSERASEHLMTIQDCIAALRINMRAASDETAIMPGDAESVQVVTDAISQAMEQIEVARDSLRTLGDLFEID